MCGIVAYIGNKDAYPILINGLRRLEYRGYDSAGVAILNTDQQLDGLTFDKTFTDRCSGGSPNRPALGAMLEFVREGDRVFVLSIDRLAKDTCRRL